MLRRIPASAASLIVLLAWSAPLVGQQADRGQTQALSRRAADRIQALHQEADRLAAEERTLLGELRRLEIDRQIKNEELADVTARAGVTARELAKTNEQVTRLEREDLAARPELSARLVELYKLGHARYLRVLLSVSDVRSLGQASRMVASLAARDRERIASHQKRLQALKTARVTLQQQAKELAELRVNAERSQLAAARAIATRNAMIAKIDAARDLNAQLAGELQAAQQKLQSTLRALASGAAAAETSLPVRPFRGDLDWPVTGNVRQPFGRPSSGRPPSNGIEIAAAEGAPVHVIHDGTVAFADAFTGFGKLVIVDHGSQVFSLYGNLLDIAVGTGARIAHAAVIGRVGPSQTSSAPAATSPDGAAGLYFELRVDGRPVDPLQWLKRK
jgi:septal ring factor EnvC (AmiA/AmiB activator)